MIRAFAPAALAFALVASPAAADSRLLQVMYDESKIVRIDGKVSVQASIVFAEDELIENVAIGDSASWQVTPNKRANILFVKPLDPRASTNMTVVTNKRTYLFDLVASPHARPLYVLRFDYPPEPAKPAEPLQLAQGPNGVEQAALAAAQIEPVDPATLNFAWTRSGDKDLLPQRAYDDGEMTYLSWAEGRELPAILITNSEGTEGPVNFTVRGDVIVIDGVPPQIVLRAGKDSAKLVNTAPAASAAQDNQGTSGGTALASAQEIK